MGDNRLFIPQEVLDTWVVDGRAELKSRRLDVEGEGAFELEPASHFVREAAGEDDPHDIVGRVKAQAGVEAIGAEVYMDSAICGDNAYDVIPGFLAVPLVADGTYGPTVEARVDLSSLGAPELPAEAEEASAVEREPFRADPPEVVDENEATAIAEIPPEEDEATAIAEIPPEMPRDEEVTEPATDESEGAAAAPDEAPRKNRSARDSDELAELLLKHLK